MSRDPERKSRSTCHLSSRQHFGSSLGRTVQSCIDLLILSLVLTLLDISTHFVYDYARACV